MRCFSVTSYAVLSAASILQIHSSLPLTDAFTNPATQRRQLSSPSVEGMFAAADHSSCQENDALSRSRRTAFSRIVFGGSSVVAAIVTVGSEAFALDMDAFINSQLEADTKNCDPKKDPKCIPKLTGDEALCKYGQSGTARGEACKRVKESGGALDKPGSQGRSLGGAYAM